MGHLNLWSMFGWNLSTFYFSRFFLEGGEDIDPFFRFSITIKYVVEHDALVKPAVETEH